MRRPHPTPPRGRKGVALLMFLIIVVPLFIFGAGLAIDLSRLVTGYNYSSNTAQLAANAGATARDTTTGLLNPGEATRRAGQVCERMGFSSNCAVANGAVIEVTVPVQQFTLVSQWFINPIAGRTDGINWSGFNARASASVCNSLENVGTSDQFCVRPGPYYSSN